MMMDEFLLLDVAEQHRQLNRVMKQQNLICEDHELDV
jgi:hypothetical protein